MLRGLRRKFVAVSMLLVALLLTAVLAAVFLLARYALEEASRDVLRRAIRENPGKYGTQIAPNELALPYFTVNILGDTAYITGGTYADNLEDTEQLSAIVDDCLSMPEDEGTLPGYGLRYLRRNDGWHIRLAFVDMSMETVTLRNIFGACLVMALCSLLPLLVISILLSRWALRPVERAWTQQRQFLSDSSHELKTPLTVILSNADLLQSAGLSGKPERWAENIRSEGLRMKTLLEEMLTLARADNLPASAVLGEVCLSDVAADCALSFEPVSFEAGKPLRYEIAPEVRVAGDAERLRRLVSILLDNAIKYGAAGGAITLTLERLDRQARLTVANPGEPIPPEKLSRLFERFYRADASRGEQSGFGLGLSIADAVAREHRGSLKAESDDEETQFIFTMPVLKRKA